ncbi:MAG: hypothetical protein JNM39_01990 [Bdellovibrionaceae bacterium]|nr:hypothetical protein [Pseudobdellovibrionaceae bacterium]
MRTPSLIKIIGFAVEGLVLGVFLSACSGGGGSEFSALDSTVNGDKIPCSIKEKIPSTQTVKVSSIVGTTTSFNITPSTSSCQIFFYVNGTKVNTNSLSLVGIDSSTLLAGTNTVRVEASNDLGRDYYEWTVTKNTAPTCAKVSPAAGSINMVNTGTQLFTASGAGESGETLRFSWLLDGQANAAVAETISGATASQGSFTANASLNGTRTVSAVVSDGLDSVTCSWTVAVGDDCSITAKTPDLASVRLAAVGGTGSYSVTTTTASCLVVWALNGVELTGTTASRTINSIDLNTGSNLLKAEVTSSSGNTSKSWTLVKNSPPTCNQSPPSSGSQASVGSPLALTANIVDSNGDAVTWNWFLNGLPVANPPVVIANGTNTTTATFTPGVGNIGYNSFLLMMSDGYDSATCPWNVQVNPNCTVSASSPVSTTVTVPSLGSTVNTFSITPSDATCVIAWSLNGINLGNSLSMLNILSSNMIAANTLTATVSNSSSSGSATWTVTKNTPPTCASQNPASSGHIFGVGAVQPFVANITDPNAGQSLSFDWRLDGSPPGGAYFGISSGPSSSTGTWTSTSGQVGTHNLLVNVSDSYDTVACSWPVEVLRTCAVSSASPSGASLRVANLGSTNTSFGVVANDPSCVITWKLNGTTVSTGANFQDFLSSAILTSNTVEAVLANSVSTITRSWSVTKNTPPVCQSQTPVSNGNTVDIGNSLAFNMSATDANTDALTYSWALDGSASATFSSVTGVGYNASATFTPGLGQVGLGHAITSTMSDGYDTQACSWTVDVIDPNSAQILSWTPVSSPVVILSNGSAGFTVNATGTGLTYEWALDGVIQAGMTTSAATFSYSDMSVGNHTLVVTVRDTYTNQASHTFNIRRNAAPAVSGYSPNVSGITNYRIGYQQSFNFSVTATDGNGDVLSYVWELDNSAAATLVGSGATAVFSPAGNTLLLGPHTVKVVVSDGYESSTTTWSVMVNYFSDECNDLYNSASTGSNGGRVCTLVGNPSMGHKQDIKSDPTLLRAKPWTYLEIQAGIYAISDHVNHAVQIYNSNSSGNFTGFGHTILPTTTRIVLGNGAAGRNSDASTLTDAFQNVGSPAVSMPVFKLYQPYGIAYDSTTGSLYVADRQNHRVLALSSSGQVLRILGEAGGAATNNSTSNIEGNFGNTHSCNQPVGLTISGRYLYVACSSQFVIKKVNIDDPNNAGTYGITTTAVGRQNNSTTTKVNYITASGWALPDGPAGADSDPATGATALTGYYPFEMASDGNGVIYWNEQLGAGHGLRIRAFNPGASAVDLTPTINANMTSAAILTIRGLELTLAGAVPSYDFTRGVSQAVNVSAGTLNNFLLYSHARMAIGGCHAVSVTMRNSGNVPISNVATVTVTMTGSAAATYFSDSTCTTPLAGGSSNQFTFPIGATHQTIFVIPSTAATYTWTATAPGPISSTTSSVVAAAAAALPAPPTATTGILKTFASPRFLYNECLPIELQFTTSGGVPAPAGGPRYVVPDKNNIGSFYSDSSCTTQISRVLFGASDINKYVFYKRNIYIPAGWVATVAGYDNGNAASYNEYANGVKIGDLKLLSNPTGLDILRNGTTGHPDAIGWATDGNSVSYLNLRQDGASESFGGRTFSNLRSDIIFALPNSLVAPTAVSAGYNGDDQAAWGSSLSSPQGVRFNLAKNSLLVTDYTNKRGRLVELNAGGFSRAFLGLGRDRFRTNVTGINATQVSLYNPYKVEVFSGSLYFSEPSNNWIRRVNLTTGIVDTVAGNGLAVSYTEGNDAGAEGMKSPRGFKLVAYPNSASPTNYVLFYVESTSCIVRAVNVSGPSIANFYGVGTLLPGKVKTVAGDWSYACTTWATSGNTEGMAATSAKLNGPEDIAYVNGDLYILQYLDNCLVKVDSNGLLTRPQGGTSCSTTVPATTNDSTMDAMRTRYPRSFYPDMGKPGNYFMVDQYADVTGFVRYLNTLTSSITFKNTAPVTVSARAVGANTPLVVKTIYQQTASTGASNIGGVTSWSASSASEGTNDKVCWSAGALGLAPFAVTPFGVSGTSGAHAIYCANRYQDDDGNLAAGPSNASGIRAGAPIDREQEKIGRLNATFYSPYGLAFDDDGNLYVSEYENHIIRMIRRWW